MATEDTVQKRSNWPCKEAQFKPGNQASKGVRNGKGSGVLVELKKILRREFPGDPQKRKAKEVFAASLLVNAIKGNGTAIKQLLDRLEGPVPTTYDDDSPLKVLVEYVKNGQHPPAGTPFEPAEDQG